MNEDTRETVVEYALRRAATISTEIDYEDNPELGSEIYVMDARRQIIRNLEIPYADFMARIEECTVEIIYGQAYSDVFFRAYRIIALKHMDAIEYQNHRYTAFLLCKNQFLGTFTVRYGSSAWYYIVDRWYNSEEDMLCAEADTAPDLLGALYLMTKLELRNKKEQSADPIAP